MGKDTRGGNSIFILPDVRGLDMITYFSGVHRSSNQMHCPDVALEANTILALDIQPQSSLSRVVARILALALPPMMNAIR